MIVQLLLFWFKELFHCCGKSSLKCAAVCCIVVNEFTQPVYTYIYT